MDGSQKLKAPNKELSTQRLILRCAEPSMAESLADFHVRNREHLAPWSPWMPEEGFTVEGQRDRLKAAETAFLAGISWRWIIFPVHDSAQAVGNVHVSQVVRGVSHSAMLGYALDQGCQGQGLMHEALSVAIDEVFSERGGLHRLQANVMPHNLKSLGLLDRLGFEHEGLARSYLYLDGKWQNHMMLSLINPGFEMDWTR